MRRALGWMIVAATGLAAVGAAAAPVDGRTARRALFSAKGAEAVPTGHGLLSDKDAKIIAQIAATQKYYGAVAISPDEGLMSKATVAAANYHSVEAARAAALKACEAARSGKRPCAVVAEIVPKRWKPGAAVQLSTDATAAFRSKYLRAPKPRALAISPSSGVWGVAGGANAAAAAIAACAAKAPADAPARDCAVVIAD